MKTLIAIALALFVTATATPANAQSEIGATSLGTQLAIELESGSNAARAQTLHQIVETASYHKEFDLSATVPSLEEVYRTDPDPRYRLMALAALHTIGDRGGMRTVRAHVKDQTDHRVQVASIAAVCDYFGTETFRGNREIAAMARNLLATR